MKTLLLFLAVFSGTVSADQYVNPYFRQDGSFVQGYMRSSPDGNINNNYSTQGNTNPYTGQRGYVQQAPSYGSVYSPPNPASYLNGSRNPYGYGR